MAIDIMMPFYGDVGYLERAVESVLAQTGDWRLVIVDDRYPDPAAGEYIRGIDDSRVEYVVNDENLGINGNFRRCVQLARAEYTVIIGGDDVMLPGYVEHLTSLAQRFPEADYFQPGVATIDASGTRGVQLPDRVKAIYRPKGSMPRELRGQELAVSLLRGNWTYFPSICWKTSTLKAHDFRVDFDIVLDLALQLEIAMHDGTLVVDDRVVFEYRRHKSASAWSGSEDRRFSEEKRFFLEIADRMRAHGWVRASRTARSHVSSRLNAAAQLPGAVLGRDRDGTAALIAHMIDRRRDH